MHAPQDTNVTTKKTWVKPVLVAHGTVEELTGTIVKKFGFSDGFAVIDGQGTITDIGFGS
ncbi:MAG: hypothetical protein K8J31_26525 [Anaerolineae bacterium]|nr:hypothetical protein [Anaerolineae bacterium]